MKTRMNPPKASSSKRLNRNVSRAHPSVMPRARRSRRPLVASGPPRGGRARPPRASRDRPPLPSPRTRLRRSPAGPGKTPTTDPSIGTAATPGAGGSTTKCSAMAPAIERSRSVVPAPRTRRRSQACSMSVMTCDERSAVAPFARTASTRTWRNSRRASGSRLASGSSRRRTGARVPSASASPTCACCPPDSSSARDVSGMSRSSSRWRAIAGSKPGRSDPASATCSSTVSSR